MKAKKFLVILCLLAVALLAVACGEEETTTAEPVVTTTAEATTTAATTTEATTTAATTTAAATTTKATTKATTAAATTTTVATTAAPAPVAPADPYLWNGNVATAFAGGTGTAEDPYQIANGAQLALMAETFEKGAYYILVDDIMLNDVYNFEAWGTGALRPLNPWTPIEGFNANFDGKGKTIYGLYGIPLFKTTKDATISNIGIAYADVEDALLIGTATDTNIAGITFVKDTTFVDGNKITLPENATADDIINAIVSERLITVGDNPEVWGFEALAVGALATDLYVANDKLGTAFTVTVVDDKGYIVEETDGKMALAWDANDAAAQTLVLNLTKDATAIHSWHGANEVLVYVDGSEVNNAYKFGIAIIDAEGTKWTLAADKAMSILKGYAWEDTTSTGAEVALAANFKGFVRIPLSAFVNADNAALGANISVAQIALTVENAGEGVIYIDSIRLSATDSVLAPNTLPNLAPAYGITVLQDFSDASTEVSVPDNHKENATVAIKDGKFNINWLKDSGPDGIFAVKKTITSDIKGFMIYIDATEANPKNPGNKGFDLYKEEYIGLNVTVAGKTYQIGTHGNLGNYSYIQSDNCGNWIKTYNINNNRICLPTHGYNGWMFLPIENFTEGGKATNAALTDVLAASENGLTLEKVTIYTNGNKNVPAVLKLDNFYAVTGEAADTAPVVENAPATLPNDTEYTINDNMLDVDNDEFFRLWQGSIADDKGVDGSAAIKFTSGENATANNKTTKVGIISTVAGDHLMGGMDQSGFMMWVDLSQVESADGKTVNFGIKAITHWNEDFRIDSQAAWESQGGNYWTFEISASLNKFGDEAFIYADGEDSEWETVSVSSGHNSYVLPAGFAGYIYIPFNEFSRSNSSLYDGNNGFEAGYNYFRFFEVHVGNTTNANKEFYIDNMMVVAADGFSIDAPASTEKLDKMPAKLPGDVDYNMGVHFGFESADEFNIQSGSATKFENLKFSTDRAVSGNALSFTTKDNSVRAELYCDTLSDQFVNLAGTTGILWHMDFSMTERDTANANGICASITVNGNMYRSNGGSKIGYYMIDGTNEWVETKAVNGCRMALPDGFKGWIYVPITAYGGGNTSDGNNFYNKDTGVVFDIENLDEFRIYTDGYIKDTNDYITIDELTFVRAK